MAVRAKERSDCRNGKEYSGKLTSFVCVACLVAATGGLILGYDMGISGGVTSMDSFLLEFFPSAYNKGREESVGNQHCKYDNEILTLFTSSLYLVASIASIFASDVTKSLGRKWSMFIGGVTFLIGSAFSASAHDLLMLIIGRIFLGIGVGFTVQAVPLYLSEMAPTRVRGKVNISFQFMITVGTLLANIINYRSTKIGSSGWRLSLGLAAIPACIVTIGTLFIPDTPNSLLDRGYQNQAKEILKRIRGTNEVEAEYNDMVLASEEAWKSDHPWKIVLRRKYRPQLIMATVISLFHVLTGYSIIMFYAPFLLESLGFEDDASVATTIIIGFVNLLATLVSFLSVDKFGRRVLLLQGGVQMLISDIVKGTLTAVEMGTHETEIIPSRSVSAVILVFLCIYVAGYAWSWGPLGWLVPSEIFSLEVRSVGQSITVSLKMLITFFLVQISLSLICHMKSGLFLFFGLWILLKTLFVAFFLPETKNVPVEEMSLIWKKHWYWKRFTDDDEVDNEC